MFVTLKRVGTDKAEFIWKMQVEAFSGLLEKYRDTETNPAAENVERVKARLEQPFTYYYIIECGGEAVGAIRVVDRKYPLEPKRISPVFVLEKYRNRGIARQAVEEAERLHGQSGWTLETIGEEDTLCRMYEKLGYVKTGRTERVNERMTLVFYEK